MLIVLLRTKSVLKSVLKTVLAARLLTFSLAVLLTGFGLAIGSPASAAHLTSSIIAPWVIAQTASSPDLDQAAEKAEEASERIFEGLDRTKRVVGKTEPRNEVIEEARKHASKKWQSLADKTKAAKESDESLSPVDENSLKQVLESDQK
jgi:hypothetical protein